MAGNAAFEGEVALKYFALGATGGRGSPVRFMLFVHDVEFKEIKVAPDASWMDEKKRLIESGECPTGTVPVLYIGDKCYSGHIPIVKYLAAKFNAISEDPDVRYRSDAMLDEYTTWRNAWGDALFDEEKKKVYLEKREGFYTLLEKLYEGRSDEATPYFMGLENPGYDDLCVFAMIRDDELDNGEMAKDAFPTLKALYEKVQEIPSIAAWIEEVAAAPAPEH